MSQLKRWTGPMGIWFCTIILLMRWREEPSIGIREDTTAVMHGILMMDPLCGKPIDFTSSSTKSTSDSRGKFPETPKGRATILYICIIHNLQSSRDGNTNLLDVIDLICWSHSFSFPHLKAKEEEEIFSKIWRAEKKKVWKKFEADRATMSNHKNASIKRPKKDGRVFNRICEDILQQEADNLQAEEVTKSVLWRKKTDTKKADVAPVVMVGFIPRNDKNSMLLRYSYMDFGAEPLDFRGYYGLFNHELILTLRKKEQEKMEKEKENEEEEEEDEKEKKKGRRGRGGTRGGEEDEND